MPMANDATTVVFDVCCMEVIWKNADSRHPFPFSVRRIGDHDALPGSERKTKGDAISWICDNHDWYHMDKQDGKAD
jgi:hypothetical protein